MKRLLFLTLIPSQLWAAAAEPQLPLLHADLLALAQEQPPAAAPAPIAANALQLTPAQQALHDTWKRTPHGKGHGRRKARENFLQSLSPAQKQQWVAEHPRPHKDRHCDKRHHHKQHHRGGHKRGRCKG